MADFWEGRRSAKGAEDFLALSKRLKAAGDLGLRKELHKAVAVAAKPLIPKIRDAARAELPKRGGLNERIAKKPYKPQVLTGAKTAGVRIRGTKVEPRIDEGRVWHPVFGRKGKNANGKKNSVVQKIPAAKGYFSKTLEKNAPEIRAEMRVTLNAFTERVAHGGGV